MSNFIRIKDTVLNADEVRNIQAGGSSLIIDFINRSNGYLPSLIIDCVDESTVQQILRDIMSQV